MLVKHLLAVLLLVSLCSSLVVAFESMFSRRRSESSDSDSTKSSKRSEQAADAASSSSTSTTETTTGNTTPTSVSNVAKDDTVPTSTPSATTVMEKITIPPGPGAPVGRIAAKGCCTYPELTTKESRSACNLAKTAESVATSKEDAKAAQYANRACLMECNYKHIKVIAENGTLDNTALNQQMVALEQANPKWSGLLQAALKKCLATIDGKIKTDQNCKSGAHEINKCLNNQMLITCPVGVKVETPECTAMIAKRTGKQ